MENKTKEVLDVNDVCQILDIGTSKAYKIIRQLNDELKSQGYITIAGKVHRKYFDSRLFGGVYDQKDQ